MAKKSTKEVKNIKKGNSEKNKETNKTSILPILGIIVALISASLFFNNGTSNIIRAYIEDKEKLNLMLASIKGVAINFIGINAIILLIEWVLYKYNKKIILYIVVIGIIAFSLLASDLSFLKVLLTPLIVGIFYSIKLLKKES